jgi:hypothetical protein
LRRNNGITATPIFTPICVNCKYTPKNKDELSWLWRCSLRETKLDYVTGIKLTVEKRCIDKNKEGQCQDYLPLQRTIVDTGYR